MNKIYYNRKTESIERLYLEVESVRDCSFRGYTDKNEPMCINVITDGYGLETKIITVLIGEKNTAIIKVVSLATDDGKIIGNLIKLFEKLDGVQIIDDYTFAEQFKTVLDNQFSYEKRLTEKAVQERWERIEQAKKDNE